MNKIYKTLLSLPILLLLATGCKKAENKVFYEGGTAPVLTASSTAPMIFTQADKNKTAVILRWTNPDYQFNTGVSSHNVNYILEVDKAGSSFSSAIKQEVAFVSELTKTFTVQELNTIITKMDLPDGVAHDLEFRIKSVLQNNNGLLYSNVVKISITPYLDIAVPLPPTGELYVTGDATPSDWTNSPPASQKFTQISKTEYFITLALADKYIKFLSTPGSWQPQYGMLKNASGVLSANMGGGTDPEAIKVDAPGTYKININFKTGKYTLVKQ